MKQKKEFLNLLLLLTDNFGLPLRVIYFKNEIEMVYFKNFIMTLFEDGIKIHVSKRFESPKVENDFIIMFTKNRSGKNDIVEFSNNASWDSES